MQHVIIRIAAAAAIAMFGTIVTSRAESTGSSCADCSTTTAEFTIKNNTRSTIYYKVKWGPKGEWSSARQVELKPGVTEIHTHDVDGNRAAPVPRVWVDVDLHPGKDKFEEGVLAYNVVDHFGYPKPGHRGEPAHFFFFAKDQMLGIARE